LKTLERDGHVLEAACDVDSAIQAVRRKHFDLIVCDFRLPGKTGLDLLIELEALGSHIPVVIVSAFADAQTEEAATKLGAVALLRKPLRRQQLLQYAAAHSTSPETRQ
jgi:CheY-like chemotaxis protein